MCALEILVEAQWQKKILQWFKPEWEVRSAGIIAIAGAPMSMQSKEVLQEHGLPTYHIAKPLTDELVEQADKIFVMTEQHRRTLVDKFPNKKNGADFAVRF